MIFKTITDETTLSGQRIVGALQARKIAQQQATAQLEIDIACLKEYQVACQNGTVTTEQFDAIMHKASASAVEYSAKVKAGTGTAQSYANTQRATNSALQEVSIGAGIASKAVKLFSTALNMIAFTAIIQGISWLIGKVDEWIVTAKEAKESADAFKQSLSTFFNETQANLKTISSLSDRFDELSKNVDDNGKKVGGTEEEYAEFLDICQQVGQIMPELITGYTAEGEAIITLQGKVDSLTDSYKEAIKAKAALFLSNGDEEGNTIESFFEDYNDFVNGYQGVLGLKTSPSGQNTAEEFEEYYGYDKIHGWLSDVTDATLEDLGKLRAGTTEYVYLARVLKEAGYEISEISAENYNAVHDVFNNRMSVMEKGITDRVTNIRTAFQNMLYADSDYWKIDDENVISAINSLYASIDDEFIKQNELFNQTALQTFESDFVSLFNNDATKKAMVDFYTPIADDETVKDYADRIKSSLETVQSYCDGNGITVPINFDDSEQTINNLEAQYQRAVDFAKDKFDGYDPTAFFKEHSINTQEEIDKWQEIAQGARDAAEAEREYIQGSTLNIFPISLSISQTVDQLNTQLKPSFDALKSAYNDIFTDDGEFALNSIDILSTCDSIKSKLDELNETEGITVDFSAYEDFVRVLSDTESTEQDVEDAFDSLATSISRATLSGAEDFETMKAALEDLGVVNNEIIAFDALVSNTEALKEAFDQANVSMDDFIVNTENGSVEATQAGRAFLEEKVGAENCTEALSILALHKELCNLQEMNTGKEVANLRTLAENAGYTGDVIKYLTELERIYQEVASGTLTPAQIGIKLGKAAILKNMIDNAASKIQYAPKVDWSGAVKGAAKAGKAAGKSYADSAKSALDSFKEALDNFMDAQEKALDAGKITFQEYCNTVSTYIREAYDSGKISAKDFWDYQGRFLEKQKSIYDKVVRAVTRKIDDELDKLKDKQDEIDKFYDSQISSLEKTKKLLQETNDERKRQTDLQKALYDMERAYNQRTVLQYSDEKGMHYVSDPKAIRDARENVASTRLEIQIAEIDKSISRLEELRDKEKSALEDIIEKLEDYKEKWNDVTSAYEEAQEDQLAAMILGQGWEADILSMRTETLTNFANDYIRIQQAIADAAWESANAQIAAQQAAMSAISNPSSTVPDKKETSDAKSSTKSPTKKYNSVALGIKAGASHLANVFSNLKFHTGLRQGLVGSHSFDDDFKLVQSVGLKENEVPAILKKGEAVATQEQISNIADGLRQGNNSESQTVVINGTEYRPLQPGDKMYDLVQKFDAYLERINHNIDMLTPNSVYEHQRQMEDMAKQINYVNSVTNNNRNTQPVVNHINVTCPGVTSQQVAEQLGSVIGKELDKQFNGFHNYTDQMSRIR